MKKDEIHVGQTYVGKNGRKRRVVSEGGSAYSGQLDWDTLNYVDVNASATARPRNITRASFASWAARQEGK